MKEARSETTEKLDRYTFALKREFEEHKKAKELEEANQLKAETEEIKRENNKRMTQELMQIRRQVRAKEEELKDKLFKEVEASLEEYFKTDEYRQLLIRQINEAVTFANGEEINLYIDPADEALREELQNATGAKIYISAYPFHRGMRGVINSINVLIDNSFETKLMEEKEVFRFKGGAQIG